MSEEQKEASVAGTGYTGWEVCGAGSCRPFMDCEIQHRGSAIPSEGLEHFGEGSDFCCRTMSPAAVWRVHHRRAGWRPLSPPGTGQGGRSDSGEKGAERRGVWDTDLCPAEKGVMPSCWVEVQGQIRALDGRKGAEVTGSRTEPQSGPGLSL